MHKSGSPSWHSKHDTPSRSRYCPLSLNRQFDFIKLRLDPIVIAAVVVEFLEYNQCFVRAINLDQVSWRFWEEHHSAE